MKKNKKKNKQLFTGKEFDRLSKQFYSLTGETAEKFFFPGLKNRQKKGTGSALVTTRNKEKLIMTYRHNIRLAELEAKVLFNLSKLNAPVPRLITRNGHWLIQEYLGGKRLTQSLNTVSPELQCNLLESAIWSLAEIQRIAGEVRFHLRVKPICMGSKWREGRINFPVLLGNLLGLPAPTVDKDALFNALIVEPDTFVKWDARAGNAIVQKDGRISWFDWEHCGCRSSLDDLVWFLSDEWIPSNEGLDRFLIENSISLFHPSKLKVSAKQYLLIHATLHMCGRLVKILDIKKKNSWWSRGYCLEFDQMGVTLGEASNLAQKASRWAGFNGLTAPLSGWLRDVDASLRNL